MNQLYSSLKIFFYSFYLYQLTDLIEILFFASIFYYFSLWLRKDYQKPLIYAFYTYNILILSSYYFNLSTMSYTLFLCSPCVIMIFILIHQKTLQKNFITLHNIVPSKDIFKNWIETLVRVSLHAINNKKSIIWLIENKQNLKDLIKNPFIINTPLQEQLMLTLLESASFDQKKFVWLKNNGTLMSVNANIHESRENFWTDPDLAKEDQWKQDAALFTKKTDAIIVYNSPKKEIFTLIAQGSYIENINAHKVLTILQAYTEKEANTKSSNKNSAIGAYFDETSKTTAQQQRP